MILNIELDSLVLQFNILNNPMALLWLDRMQGRDQWPMDDPNRFYGFNSQEQDKATALQQIQQCCGNINQWNKLIDRNIQSVYDQDSLNYLHNVFEKWHGLLDQQPTHPEFGTIPDHIRQHLADLNVLVHRCETVARGNRPRIVCTWYGMPKTQTLSTELMKQYGTLNPKFGSVCLNYCEIGKTLEDLTQDNDKYISDNAFRPFSYYSADFNVRLHSETVAYCSEKLIRMKQYYNNHREFFYDRGYQSFDDPRLLPLRFPVAELIETMPPQDLINAVAQQQTITRVWIQ
jgi:hypothetical protein